MSLIESNSTKLLLPPNGVYQGRAVRPDVKYITIQITATFEGGNSGLLEIYYSIDGIFYDTFGDSWTYTTLTNEVHVFKETQMKGSFFYVKWTNNGISAYTSFNLNTKLAETTSTVSVNGVIDIPEVDVNIEGQTVFSKIRDTSGNALNSTENALNVYNINTIEGYALEDTLLEIKNKTDSLNFFDNDGIAELSVFDIQNYTELNSIKTYTNKLYDLTYTDNNLNVDVKNTVDISGSVNINNFPAIQDVSGNVNITNTSLAVTGTFYPSIQDVSGSVNVSNFPAIQDVSGNVNITNSSLAVTGTFYPSIQDVSGSVNVSNFPATQNVSGSVSVSNQISGYSTSALQTTGNNLLTDIKNKTLDSDADSVTVYAGGENGLNIRYLASNVDSVDVGLSTYAWSNSNPPFPATRDVLGSQLCGVNNLAGDNLINLVSNASGHLIVNVDNQPTSIEVSNFPDIQDVSGNVNITNTSLAVTGSFYPAIQDVSGNINVSNFPATQNVSGNVTVNTISNFALETGGNLASIKTNSDKLKYVDDDLKTVISNTGFDAKVRDGNNNVITSTVYGIDGVRGLDVSIKNATQAEPLVVEIPVTNVINTFSTNLPVTYEIAAGGYLSSAVGALNVNLRNTAGDATGISGSPLVVQNSNNISGFALETGGNLATVATNSNKFKFTGDFLKTEVNASVTNPLIVEELNPLTNYAMEDGGNISAIRTILDQNTYDASGNLKVNVAAGDITVSSVNIKDSSGNNLNSTSNALNNYITNSSLDTHCYASSDGTNWHHLKSTNTGNLITESKTHDGSNVPITSTLNGAKQSLDVNVANTGSIKVDISGVNTDTNRLNVFDASANTLLSRINVGSGASIMQFSFGNILNNTTINTGAVSTTINITAGGYGRRAMLMYRDGATSSTDSITYYTDSNLGTPESLLLQTVYPIVNAGYRWSNVVINILPFTSIKVRNDSSTINNTAVYLTVVAV